MASKAIILSEIQAKVGSNCGVWRIGLTHDLAERKAYWRDTKQEDVKYWSQWTANSLSDAQDVERHFINKGAKGGTGGDLSAYKTVYIYVF